MAHALLLVAGTALVLQGLAPALPAQARDASPYEEPREPGARNRIDQLVFRRLREKGIRPARPCTDAVFLRRASLDLCGRLPALEEARAFLGSRDPHRRRDLVERLLASDAFAAYQAMRWCDVLRVKSEFPINLWPNAAQAYDAWVRDRIADGTPYDRFVRQLVTASGSNFRVPQVNFYRAVQGHEPETIARAVALTFLGQRAEHWSSARLAGFAGFFRQLGFKGTAEWKEEVVYHDPAQPARTAVFPDGGEAVVAPGQDPREVLAAWLVAEEGSGLARCAVNRVWAWLMGRGIVHEADDLRPDNPPSHPAVLAWLEHELVASGWDLRHVYRLILGSQTYALSCVPRDEDQATEAMFACAILTRLDAEVLLDVIDQITGTTDSFSSAIPEPFTFLPPEAPAVTIPDGSITSPFLEMFGRPARDTGLMSERGRDCSAEQRLHLLNSGHVQRKLEQGPRLRALLQSRKPLPEVAEDLYLTILSRTPTDAEVEVLERYVAAGKDRRAAGLDVAWALLNGAEFQFRH